MKWVYAAYTATWIIHIGYLLILTRGYRKLREDVQELERD